ncbi:MAG: hypothetical protein M3R48_00965 [Candidatus Dormibacteraeota bacterium]|nr:hypothetical protein [Candidatus Dormibacteraeota bacterium]
MRRHEVDMVSLGFGLVFTTGGVLLLLDRVDVLAQGRWVVPALLIAVALAILTSVLWPQLSRGGTGPDNAAPDDTSTAGPVESAGSSRETE